MPCSRNRLVSLAASAGLLRTRLRCLPRERSDPSLSEIAMLRQQSMGSVGGGANAIVRDPIPVIGYGPPFSRRTPQNEHGEKT